MKRCLFGVTTIKHFLCSGLLLGSFSTSVVACRRELLTQLLSTNNQFIRERAWSGLAVAPRQCEPLSQSGGDHWIPSRLALPIWSLCLDQLVDWALAGNNLNRIIGNTFNILLWCFTVFGYKMYDLRSFTNIRCHLYSPLFGSTFY